MPERSLLLDLLANVARRLREGPNAPLRLAFFGPTGAGKSKIFNSLIGKELSPAGFRRPFTMRSVYSVPEAWQHLFSDIPGDLKVSRDSAWNGLVLIDTPDFDSVERRNRDEAERVFREADAFVFVTDSQKYADQSTWEYLARISKERKRAIIVLNKVSGETAPNDFFSLLGRRLQGESWGRAVVHEYPVDDETPLPPHDPGMDALRKALADLVSSSAERRATVLGRFRSDLERLLEVWKLVRETLDRYLEGISALRARLDSRYRPSGAELEKDVDAALDPALRAEVYSRVLERLQRIDILRYPRKLMALPLKGVALLWRKCFPRRAPTEAFEDAGEGEAFHVFESSLLALAEETRQDFESDVRCPHLLNREKFLELHIAHEELKTLYRQREEDFREWLKGEARETASMLTGENKLKFILSQVIYNSVIIWVQVHTAGGFSLAELVTDGVLSPLVAKAVGMAISSESVTRFAKRARGEHHRRLLELADEARLRFDRYLESRVSWRPTFETLAAEMEVLGREKENVFRAFEASGPRSLADEGGAHVSG